MTKIKFAFFGKTIHLCLHHANEQHIQTLVARNGYLRCVAVPCLYYKYLKEGSLYTAGLLRFWPHPIK